MAKKVKCFFCKKLDLKVNFVKIKTASGEKYSCNHHPGIKENLVK